jgi:hypothetical protein
MRYSPYCNDTLAVSQDVIARRIHAVWMAASPETAVLSAGRVFYARRRRGPKAFFAFWGGEAVPRLFSVKQFIHYANGLSIALKADPAAFSGVCWIQQVEGYWP